MHVKAPKRDSGAARTSAMTVVLYVITGPGGWSCTWGRWLVGETTTRRGRASESEVLPPSAHRRTAVTSKAVSRRAPSAVRMRGACVPFDLPGPRPPRHPRQ